MALLDVFFTVDVEVWCDGWQDIDRKFPEAFKKYIFGPTAAGELGLPYQLKVLADHGVLGTFFVEPLFSTRFGQQSLQEIVGLIRSAGQEVQLHLHPEWVDESVEPLIANVSSKRQHLFQYTVEEQTCLIGAGIELLERAGATGLNAFRAGSFGFNRDTLRALAINGIAFDSSYNATMFGAESGVSPGQLLFDPTECEGVLEYPVTVFKDGLGSYRHVQLTACSHRETEGLLWQAAEQQRRSFIILFHNFELLSPSKTRPDPIVVDRFRRLCKFLERHRDVFRTTGFSGLSPKAASAQRGPLTTSLLKTAGRVLEQTYRRKYR